MGQGSSFYCLILDQNMPFVWPGGAVDSGVACLHLQTTALQTHPGDWRNPVVGSSIISPADGSLGLLLVSGFINSNSTGHPLFHSLSVQEILFTSQSIPEGDFFHPKARRDKGLVQIFNHRNRKMRGEETC